VCEPFNHSPFEIARNQAIFLEIFHWSVHKNKIRRIIISPFYHAWHNLDDGM